MIGMGGAAHISALKGEFVTKACDKFGPQAANAPFLNQKSKTALGAGLARAVVAVNLDEFHHDRRGLKDFDKYIQRRSHCESSGAHLAAHQNVEAKPARLFSGNESDILRFAVRAVVRATADRDVELARQVGELGVTLAADDNAIQFVDDRRGVKHFVRRESVSAGARRSMICGR